MATEEIRLDDDCSNDEIVCDEFQVETIVITDDTAVYKNSDSPNSFCNHHNHNNNTMCPQSSTSSRAPSPTPCSKCQKVEAEAQAMMTQLKSQSETEIARLKKEVEMATKTKESVVMKYANSEMEVLKLKRDLETSNKSTKQLNTDIEIATKKHKMLSSERERLSLMIDEKVHEVDRLHKEINRLQQEISSRDFKITWTQNKLREETESHKSTQQRLESRVEEIEKELELLRSSQTPQDDVGDKKDGLEENSLESKEPEITLSSQAENDSFQLVTITDEIQVLKEKNKQLVDENNSLLSKVNNLEEEKLTIEAQLVRLQDSNSEHLHQIASLHSDLSEIEVLKVQLQKEEDNMLVLQKGCQMLNQTNNELMNDIKLCQAKEAELLAYTQEVTERNVALQSNFSSVEAKSIVHKDENERLLKQIEQLENDLHNIEQMMSEETKIRMTEKQCIENDANSSKRVIEELQCQLDEARGEIGLLNRKLNSSVRELSKELYVIRKQVKDGQPSSDGLSQSSRTSSSSSLTNGDCSPAVKSKQEDFPSQEKLPDPTDCPVIPDQQVLIERIVKLQRTLAKKQDKVEFLQEHVNQLVESLQRKSKIIQAYAMSQDIDAMSSNLAEQNKAEALKHGGIMASVYGSKPADEGMTLGLSLEINRKLQVVLEDTLLKNITLKDSLNTLGKEISKLTETNQDLQKQIVQTPNNDL